jgi:hypothetical protein
VRTSLKIPADVDVKIYGPDGKESGVMVESEARRITRQRASARAALRAPKLRPAPAVNP